MQYTPRHDGKAERCQRILVEELPCVPEFNCEDTRNSAITI